MIPLLPLALIAGLGATAAYQYGKDKGKKKASVANSANISKQNENSVAQNVYNYNYLNDSNTGNTLFDSQKKTKRTLFGAGV